MNPNTQRDRAESALQDDYFARLHEDACQSNLTEATDEIFHIIDNAPERRIAHARVLKFLDRARFNLT